MTPATEKAAPIPAEVSQAALAALRNAIADKRTETVIKMTIAGPSASAFHDAIARAIMQDRADRASQEERIREDELDRLYASEMVQRPASFALRAWLESDGAMLPADRARLRGGAS